ncbi:molybdopterin oxidoreductase, partial [Mesorhizobium sp. M00.F.Ca.ET.149.01.1.1]
MAKFQITRRKFLTASSLGLSGIALSGWDAFDSSIGIDGGLRSYLEHA